MNAAVKILWNDKQSLVFLLKARLIDCNKHYNVIDIPIA